MTDDGRETPIETQASRTSNGPDEVGATGADGGGASGAGQSKPATLVVESIGPVVGVMPKAPSRTWHARFFYWGCHLIVSLIFALFFRLRVAGRENIPPGGMLVCCNHQSHLDPVLVGLACREPITYLARDTLFKGWFAKLIIYLGAIPIQRDGLGLNGVKKTLERLKIGEKVLIFPEGTRSPDGQLQTLKGGLALIARRAKVPLLPVAIEGAYHAWPRKQKWPTPQTIQMTVGPPIPLEVVRAMDDEQLTALLAEEIRKCWETARTARLHRIG